MIMYDVVLSHCFSGEASAPSSLTTRLRFSAISVHHANKIRCLPKLKQC